MFQGYHVPCFARCICTDVHRSTQFFAAVFSSWSGVPELIDLNDADADEFSQSGALHAAIQYQGKASLDFFKISIGGEDCVGLYQTSPPNLRPRLVPQIRVEDCHSFVEQRAAPLQERGVEVLLPPSEIMGFGVVAVLRVGGAEINVWEELRCRTSTTRGEGRLSAMELRYRQPADLELYAALFDWKLDEEGRFHTADGGFLGYASALKEGLPRWICYFGATAEGLARAHEHGAEAAYPLLSEDQEHKRQVLYAPDGIEFGVHKLAL